MYLPVDGPSSVSKSGIKSLLRMQSLACGSRLNDWSPRSGVCICTYPGGTPSVSKHWVPSLSSDDAGGIPGGGGARRGWGAPVASCRQHVSALFTCQFWQGRQPSVWFSPIIAGCVSSTPFTILCPGNTIIHFFSSQTSAQGFLICCSVSSIAARKNPSLAIMATFKARRMSDCSSCTQPPCFAIVAAMLKT